MPPTTEKPTLKTAVKYTLLQLPGAVSFLLVILLLRQWVDMPPYLTWGLIGVWVGKDIALFPFLWRSYDSTPHNDRFDMVNRKGYALSRLEPQGSVRIQGERWRAVIGEGEPPIEKGEPVCVEAVHGLRLTVRRWVE